MFLGRLFCLTPEGLSAFLHSVEPEKSREPSPHGAEGGQLWFRAGRQAVVLPCNGGSKLPVWFVWSTVGGDDRDLLSVLTL